TSAWQRNRGFIPRKRDQAPLAGTRKRKFALQPTPRDGPPRRRGVSPQGGWSGESNKKHLMLRSDGGPPPARLEAWTTCEIEIHKSALPPTLRDGRPQRGGLLRVRWSGGNNKRHLMLRSAGGPPPARLEAWATSETPFCDSQY